MRRGRVHHSQPPRQPRRTLRPRPFKQEPRRRIAAELQRKTKEPDDARTLVAASLLRAVAGLDAGLRQKILSGNARAWYRL